MTTPKDKPMLATICETIAHRRRMLDISIFLGIKLLAREFYLNGERKFTRDVADRIRERFIKGHIGGDNGKWVDANGGDYCLTRKEVEAGLDLWDIGDLFRTKCADLANKFKLMADRGMPLPVGAA